MPSPGQGGAAGILPTPEGLGGSSAIIFPSPIHFWPMNEGSGSTYHDSVGGLNFTVTNPYWGVLAGMGASAVAEFNNNAPTSAVASAYDASLDFNGTQPWTYSAWAYITAAGTLFSNLENPSFTGGWEIGQGVPNTIGSFAGVNSGSAFLAVETTEYSINEALFITVTYDGSNTVAGLLFYINGVVQTMDTLGDNFVPPGISAQPFQIGLRPNGTQPYGGGLAYMRVWNQVLTSAQITTLYGNGPQ